MSHGSNFLITNEEANRLNELIRLNEDISLPQQDLRMLVNQFFSNLQEINFILEKNLISRFFALLCTKPFVILTGLSGSGKTKLALSFMEWLCEGEKQKCIVPVGSDWTNREPLLGYPNALRKGDYITSNGVLELLNEAIENPNKPYFLLLDEMNLSHVERYFADFLSAMETEKPIPLHSEGDEWNDCDIPSSIRIPKNLFIIGTVNIDETTYMFSPKVLDRAGVIEFKVTKEEMEEFLKNPNKPDLSLLIARGKNFAGGFVKLAKSEINLKNISEMNNYFLKFFDELKKNGAEFGYRTASDIYRFVGIMQMLTPADDPMNIDQITDAAIIQKLLPKLHGSRKKLEPILRTLTGFCLVNEKQNEENIEKILKDGNFHVDDARFPVSLEKIIRMHKRIIQDGFTSFAEA